MILRRYMRDSRGAAAVELALILPGIAFVMLNVVDVGSYIWQRMQLDMAAHEAVGAARMMCDTDAELPAMTGNCPGYDTAMTSAAQAATSLGTDVTLSGTAEGWYCADSTGDLIPVDPTTSPDCSGTVTDSTSAPGLYMSTQASYPYSPVFPGASVASLLTTPITKTAWLRLK